MELKKFEIDGREVEFVNQFRGTRSGFAHDTTLFIDGRKVAEHTCHYLNRTWECYTYQTVMKRAVDEVEDREIAYLKDKFMRAHEYKKLTAKRKEEFDAECRQSTLLNFYRAIRAKL